MQQMNKAKKGAAKMNETIKMDEKSYKQS